MKRKSLGVVGALFLGLGVGLTPACGGGDAVAEGGTGTLNLPLASEGSSGARYRLRNATFDIGPQNYYWYGSGGDGSAGTLTSVSSESEPDADTISVSLERGYYSILLQAGWQMERVDASGTTIVEATLLSEPETWVYVAPQSTASADYQFGIGDRTVWLNGELNIGVQVYENPGEYYGNYGGEPSYGGSPSYAIGGEGGSY